MDIQGKITNIANMGATRLLGLRDLAGARARPRCVSFGCFAALTLASSAAPALGEPSTPVPVVAQPTLQEPTLLRDEPVGTNGSSSKWGFGTSLSYPVGASIYMFQFSYSAWSMGDVLVGYAFQHWNDQGQANAQTLLLGYRQFIWRGLHAEVELWPAYNPFESSVDGKTYSGFELWVSARVGYRFDFKVDGHELFVLAQPSVGVGVARQNRWPKMGSGFHPIFEPQLIVGTRF